MITLLGLPNEIIWLVTSYLKESDLYSVAKSCMDLHHRLRPSILKFSIKYRNSNLLHLSAKDNDCALFEDLLFHGANINAFFRRETVLMRAIRDSDLIKLLLKQPGLDIHLSNYIGENALWYVVKHPTYINVARVLEQPGLDLNARYFGSGDTLMHYAVFWGQIGTGQLLLLRGADCDIKNHCGDSPRDWAFHANRASMVRLISSHHVFLSASGQEILYSNDTALHQAMVHGFLDAVKKLLRVEKLLEKHERNGDTPLHLAGWMKSMELVDLLLDNPRINANSINEYGNTPLLEASRSRCDDITRRFLRHKGVDINFIGSRGTDGSHSSSLHHAMWRRDTLTLQAYLTTPGVDVNIIAEEQSPLHLAVRLGQIDSLKILLKSLGIKIDAGGRDSPLCEAVEKGALEMVQLLVKQGEYLLVNRSTSLTRDTALCIAARGGNLEIVRALLLHCHINPNLGNRWCQHPLFLSAKRGDIQVINALLEDGRLSRFSMEDAMAWIENVVKNIIQKDIYCQEEIHRKA